MKTTTDKSITGTKQYAICPCTIVYIMLVMLTLTSWFIGQAGLSGLNITLIVLAIAMTKGLLIGDYFMGLRHLHSLWRWAIILWLLIPGSLISLAYISASTSTG